jgi:hypothetical protein
MYTINGYNYQKLNLPKLDKSQPKMVKGKKYSFVAKNPESGEPIKKEFVFQNNLGVSNYQLDTEIRKAMNYSINDMYNISKKRQPLWEFPSLFGDKHTLGIETLRPGEKNTPGMKFPQSFGNRENHVFKAIIHRIAEITLRKTPFRFYAGEGVYDPGESEWYTRHIRFNEAYFQKGAIKVEYPMVTYYETGESGTIISTGYQIHIPFKKLIQNGIKKKYEIDRFILSATEVVAIGLDDFRHMHFIEITHNLPNPFKQDVILKRKKFISLADFTKFEDAVFGILNTEQRIDNKDENYPVERLVNYAKNHIRKYNSYYPNEREIGITISDDLLFDEKYKKYNGKFCYVGQKKGTLRNVDNLDEMEKYDAPGDKTGPVVTIMGLKQFQDKKNPQGQNPLEKRFRHGTFVPIPTWEDIYNCKQPGKYNHRLHNVKVIDTKKYPMDKNSYKTIRIEDVFDLIIRDGTCTDLYKQIFLNQHDVNTFGKLLVKNFGTEDMKDKYINDMINILVHTTWRKITKKLDMETVIQKMRYAIINKTHSISDAFVSVSGEPNPISYIEGAQELDICIRKIAEFLLFIGDSRPSQDLHYLLFVYLLGKNEFTQTLKPFINAFGNQQTLSKRGNLFYNLLSAINGVAPTPRSVNFRDFLKTTIENINKDKFEKLKFIKTLFVTWSIPYFFKLVISRMEETIGNCAIVGTKGMCEYVDVNETAIASYNATTMDTFVQYKNNPGVKYHRRLDVLIVPNIHVKLPACIPLPTIVPKRNTKFFKVMILPYHEEVDKVDRLFIKGFPESLARSFRRDVYHLLKNKYDFESVKAYYHSGKFWEEEYSNHYNQHQYYMYEKNTQCMSCLYKGGYFWKFNENNNEYSEYEPLVGPMGKFYK